MEDVEGWGRGGRKEHGREGQGRAYALVLTGVR